MGPTRNKRIASPSRPSFLRVVVWVLVFFIWSSWMFVLGIMAGKGMIPDSLKLKNIIPFISGNVSTVQNPPPAEHAEDAEQEEKEPEFGFFTNLLGAPSAQTESQPPEFRYTVQLASLEEPEHAAAFIKQLQKKGISGISHRIQSAKGTWYVVRSGEFDSYSEAESYAQEIKRRLKIEPLVRKLSE